MSLRSWLSRRPALVALRARLRTRFHPLQLGNGTSVQIAVREDADDEISRALARGDFALPPHYNFLLGTLQPGEVVLDVGAHIGTFSLAAAAYGLRVVAVEASPRNAALLRRAAGRQRFGDRLRVVCAAASDRPGSLRFLEAGPYGHVAVSPQEGRTVEVPAITIDRLVRDLGLGPVAAVKLDIEGSEPAALRGMVELLSRPASPLLVYESNGHTLDLFGHTTADLITALAGLGYSSYAVRPEGLRAIRPETPQWDCVVDYFAARRLPPGLASLPRLEDPSDDESVADLEHFSQHPNPHYRAHVARTVRRWAAPAGGADAVERVRAALREDPDPAVRAAL
jgi:FkbM family methyltransferase